MRRRSRYVRRLDIARRLDDPSWPAAALRTCSVPEDEVPAGQKREHRQGDSMAGAALKFPTCGADLPGNSIMIWELRVDTGHKLKLLRNCRVAN